MCIWGRMAFGSSSVARMTAQRSGANVGSANSGVPQAGQKCRQIRSEEAKRSVRPVTATAAFGNTARAKTGEPVALWQRRQWQMRVFRLGADTA